jgi:benzoate membrane transport protein
MPIVMGMVAGVFLRFGLGLVYAVRGDFWIAAPMIVAFLALAASRRWSRRLPPLIGALCVGAAAIALLGRFHPPSTQSSRARASGTATTPRGLP